MKKTIILSIIFLLVGLGIGGAAVFKYRSGNIPAEPSFCAASKLDALMEFEGAAGNIYGTFTITNISNTTCLIDGGNFIEADYEKTGNGNLGFIQEGLPSVETYSLEPNGSVYARYHAPNGPQCSSGIHEVALSFKYKISPSEEVQFRDIRNGEQAFVANCDLLSDMTQVAITNLSDIPPSQ